MKFFALIFALSVFSCTSVQAGSSGCSGTSSLSWYQQSTTDHPQGPLYNLDASQCVVNATQADAGNQDSNTSLLAFLPASPSDGDTFTLKDTTPLDSGFDVCSTWYSDIPDGGDGNTYTACNPGGIGFEATGSVGDTPITVDGSTSDTLAEFYFSSCYTASPSVDCTPDSNGNRADGCAACTDAQLPSYWSAYPKVRYSYTATYNASTGDWVTTYAQQ